MSTATTASATQREPELRGKPLSIGGSAGIGLIAHTSVEATVRFAAELGYQVTVVKDATASY